MQLIFDAYVHLGNLLSSQFSLFDWCADDVILTTQVTQANLVVGSLVWVEDPEVSWIDAEVVEVNGEDLKTNCTSGRTVSAASHNL
jgi:hypothetical protein